MGRPLPRWICYPWALTNPFFFQMQFLRPTLYNWCECPALTIMPHKQLFRRDKIFPVNGEGGGVYFMKSSVGKNIKLKAAKNIKWGKGKGKAIISFFQYIKEEYKVRFRKSSFRNSVGMKIKLKENKFVHLPVQIKN